MNDAKLQELVAILEPPESPVFVPTQDEWACAEHLLGASFPFDYKNFINLYGAGGIKSVWVDDKSDRSRGKNLFDFADLDWMIFSPFNNSRYEFFYQKDSYFEMHKFGLKNSENDRPNVNRYEFGIFPEDGGVLPIAINAWAYDLSWRCWRDKDWTIAYLDHDEIDNEEFNGNLTSYFIHEITLGGRFLDGIRCEDGDLQKSIFVPLEIGI